MEPSERSLEQKIVEFFHRLGYRVTAPKSILGNSGSSQEFDVFAVKGEEEIVLDIASSGEVGAEEVVAFFAKIYDTRPKRPILICVSSLNHDAKSLVAMYKIETVTAKDAEGVLSMLSRLFETK